MHLLNTVELNCVVIITITFISSVESDNKEGFMSEVNFQAGEYYKSRRGDEFLAVSDDQLISVRIPCIFSHSTTLDAYYKRGRHARKFYIIQKTISKTTKAAQEADFDPKIGAALAKRLVGKSLTYHGGCSVRHWWNYFLHGRPILGSSLVFGGIGGNCPLARDLTNIKMSEVVSNEFYLQYPDGKAIYVRNMKTKGRRFSFCGMRLVG